MSKPHLFIDFAMLSFIYTNFLTHHLPHSCHKLTKLLFAFVLSVVVPRRFPNPAILRFPIPVKPRRRTRRTGVADSSNQDVETFV